MLSTKEFIDWSSNVVLFLHNTSAWDPAPPLDDEKYPDLLTEKGGNGFPTVSLMAADGRVLKQLDIPTTLDTMKQGVAELERWQKLQARAEGGDKKARLALFEFEVENHLLSYEAATKAAKELDLDRATARRIEQGLINLEFIEILKDTPRSRAAAGGEKFYAMYQQKRIPTARQETSFWEYIFAYAMLRKDEKMYESVLEELMDRKSDDPRLQNYLPKLQQGLVQLRRAKKGGK